MVKNQELDWSSREMHEIDPQHVEVQILGRIFEGRGNISSDLTDEQLPSIAEGLRHCVERIEQKEYASCVDGRRTLQLGNGGAEKIRARKAGGGLTPFAMKAISSPDYRVELSQVQGQDQLFEQIDKTNTEIGKKESGHAGIMPDGELVFDCGAAGGFIKHNQDVGKLTPKSKNAQSVLSLLAGEIPETLDKDKLVLEIAQGANEFSEILGQKNWDGKEYIAHLLEKDPESIELLEANDDELHGHVEKAIVIIDEDMVEGQEPEVGLSKAKVQKHLGMDVFVVNLNDIRRNANVQAAGDKVQEIMNITSNLLYQVEGVVANLTDGSLPVIYLKYKP